MADPLIEQPRAHGRMRLVEDRAQTEPFLAAGTLGEFQVAAGLGVERHERVDGVGGERVDLLEAGDLGVFQVLEEAASRAGGLRLSGEAETIEGGNVEMPDEGVASAIRLPAPRLGPAEADVLGNPGRSREGERVDEVGGKDDFGGLEPEEFAAGGKQRFGLVLAG